MNIIRKFNAVLYTYRYLFFLLLVLTAIANYIAMTAYFLPFKHQIAFLLSFFISFTLCVPLIVIFSFFPFHKFFIFLFSLLNIFSAVILFFISIRFPDVSLNELLHVAGEVDIYTSVEYVIYSFVSYAGIYSISLILLSLLITFILVKVYTYLKNYGYIIISISLVFCCFFIKYALSHNYLFDYSIPFFQVINSYMMASQSAVDNETFIKEMKNKPVPALQSTGKHPDIIVIVGESATRNRMGVYGYPVPTTPFLSSQNPILWKTNCVYTATADSLKAIFSSLEKNDALSDWKTKYQLLHVMQNTLYKSYWISNQLPTGYFGSTEFIITQFADYKWFAEPSQYDEILIPEFNKIWTEDYSPKLVVLHLMGSHMWYANRYPESFNHFTHKDELTDDVHKNKIRAEYDNSLLYTDYVIENIFNAIKNDNAIIVYLSDHGNNVYGKYSTVGPGFDNDPDMYEIPFLFLATDKYKENNPVIWNSLKQQMYDTSDHLYDLILYLSGYQISPQYYEFKISNKH